MRVRLRLTEIFPFDTTESGIYLKSAVYKSL